MTTKAKRGFIAVTEKRRNGYNVLTGCYSRVSFTVGIVTSVTRDGIAKRVQPESTGCAMTSRDWDNIQVLDPAKLSDVQGFLAECRKRQDTSPENYQPFKNLDDVRQTARKYAA